MGHERTYGSSLVPKNRYLFIIAAAALALCLVELTEIVPLPFESALGGIATRSLVSTSSLISLISSQGYLYLFILMTLESASLPIPSEIVLPFAGYLVYQGSMNLFAAIAVGTTALVVGALIDYFVALKLGRPVVDGFLRRVGVKPETIDAAERWMNQKGAWSVLLARFVPGLRSIISIPAGLFDMALKPFFLMTLVGSFVWSTVLIYVGFSAGRLWDTTVSSSAGTLNTVLVLIVAILSAVYIGYYLVSNRRHREAPSMAVA